MLDEDAFDDAARRGPRRGARRCSPTSNGATDERLRALARRLAGRVVVDLARSRATRLAAASAGCERAPRPTGPRATSTSTPRSTRIVDGPRRGTPARRRRPRGADVATARPPRSACWSTASGSMRGERLATAAVAAAAVACRAGARLLGRRVHRRGHRVKAQDQARPPRTWSPTCSAAGPRHHRPGAWPCGPPPTSSPARRPAAASRSLLSDCRPTAGGDPVADARALDELVVPRPRRRHRRRRGLRPRRRRPLGPPRRPQLRPRRPGPPPPRPLSAPQPVGRATRSRAQTAPSLPVAGRGRPAASLSVPRSTSVDVDPIAGAGDLVGAGVRGAGDRRCEPDRAVRAVVDQEAAIRRWRHPAPRRRPSSRTRVPAARVRRTAHHRRRRPRPRRPRGSRRPGPRWPRPGHRSGRTG